MKIASSSQVFIKSAYGMLHPDNAIPPRDVSIVERLYGLNKYEIVFTAPKGLKGLRTLKGSVDEVLKLLEIAESLAMFK